MVIEWSVFVAGASTGGQRRGARKKREFEGWLVNVGRGPGCLNTGDWGMPFSTTSQCQHAQVRKGREGNTVFQSCVDAADIGVIPKVIMRKMWHDST